MRAPQWALVALCLVLPAISYRLGGSTLWIVHGVGVALAAALAVYLLHDDGILRGVFEYKPGDPALAMLAALGFYTATVGLVNVWLAPDELLRICGPHGAWVPRPDVHGISALGEWLRDRACAAYFRSAGVRGPLRGLAVVLIAAAEEVAWRGGVQQALSERLGSTRGWLAATALFGLAQLGTGNVPLALLALCGGFLWGGLYLWRGRLLPAVASHVVFSWALFYHNAPFLVRYETFHT